MEQYIIRTLPKHKKDFMAKLSPPSCGQTGFTYTGQGESGYYEDLDETQRRALPYCVTPTTVVLIKDGMIFNMNSSSQKANWKWLMKHPYVSQDGNNPSSTAHFYVENKEADAAVKVSKAKLINKAESLVLNDQMPFKEKQKLAKFLGMALYETSSLELIEEWLLNKIRGGEHSQVLGFFDKEKSGTVEISLLVKDFMNHGLFVNNRAWIVGKNDESLKFRNEASIIDFLDKPDNVAILQDLIDQLEIKKKGNQ